MKIILNENQLGGLKKTLKDSIDNVGVYQTLKRYNLNLRTLSVIFNGDMPEISCQDLYVMTLDQIKILTSEPKIFNNHNFEFYYDRMAGSLQFTCKKLDSVSNEALTGWATPYWNGECHIPIDFEYYSWSYNDQERKEKDINGDFNNMEDAPTEFNSFNDIKRWLENDYLKILSEECDKVFKEIRKVKIIVSEEQYNTLKSNFLNESEELNQYGLTADEMRQVDELAEKEALEGLENLKKNIKEKEKAVESHSKWDSSNVKDEWILDHIKKEIIEPAKKELERLKKYLSEHDIETTKERIRDWNIYSAGGLGWSFRYNRYREESLKKSLTKDNIIDLFVTALEGGSNYWYYMDLPKNIRSYGQSTSEAVGEYILQGGYIEVYDIEEYREVKRNYIDGDYDITGDLKDDKSYYSDLEETKLGYIDMDKILESIPIIKKDYPEIWERILLEEGDAGDADVFLQLCVMGEVVFG